MSRVSSHQAALDEHGFCLIKGALGGDTLTNLQAQVNSEPCLSGAGSRQLALLRPETAAWLDKRLQADCLRPYFGDGFFCVRILYFDKTPEANWPVLWHQDLTIRVQAQHELEGFGPWSMKKGVHHVQPPARILSRMITLRLHLDDAGADNGGLRVIPGSHRLGVIPEAEIPGYQQQHPAEVCEARAGDILAMKPLLLHASRRSKTPRHRRVIHMEYAADDLPAPLQWIMDTHQGMR